MIVTVTLNATMDRTLGVERFRRRGVLSAKFLHLSPAGKGINVSVSLRALEVASTAVGFVGGNELACFRQALREKGIRNRLIPLPMRTRMNTTILWSKPRPGRTHLRESGDALPESALDKLKKALDELAGPRTQFVFSSSLPPGLSARGYAELLRLVVSTGSCVVVDTSGPGLRGALGAGVSLIKPNVHELAELTGMPTGSLEAVLAAADRLLDRVPTVLVSRGRKGGMLITREGAWSAGVRLRQGRIVSPVGAGDAFLAGWLAATLRKRPPEECLAAAVAAGTANVLEPTAGTIEPKQYRKLLKSVAVKAL